MSFSRAWLGLVVMVGGSPAAAAGQLASDSAAMVDRVFASQNRTDAPGCALGVNRAGKSLYRKGYGMASLEFAVPWSTGSVSESGSVAKQFTAGVITFLAVNHKLDLDDPVRKYIPELPDYGTPISLRMLLNHTSGIRDMWTLFALAGMPIGSRLINPDQALAMIYRQRELNFPPNTRYLYSNSGYLLLAEVVKRVLGRSLADVSRDLFFAPLGMAHTQWRDDWNRVIPDRATAYSPAERGLKVDMPFMNVYGAGGLLTTVGDLLLWNENLSNPTIGGPAWVESLERKARLTNGREIDYASGLQVLRYRGIREVSHDGATGGYRTFLGRWPERALSVAVLCNLGSIDANSLGHQVADVFLGPAEAVAPPATRQAYPIASADLAAYAGRYRAPESESLVTLAVRDGQLFADLGAELPLTALARDRFEAIGGRVALLVDRDPRGAPAALSVVGTDQDTVRYEMVRPGSLSPQQVAEVQGSYWSDELDASYLVIARDDHIVVRVGDRPEATLEQTGPLSFAAPGGVALRFVRGKSGRVDGFLLFAGRVRSLRFSRR